jgi:Putative MetA-pathway of phenol degradation
VTPGSPTTLHRAALACAVMGIALASAARADDYSAFDPVPDSDLRPFCTDRPTKGTGVCTVDAGHVQIESDIFNATFDRQDGVTTDTYVYTDPTIKLGITDDTDVEASLAPFTQTIVRDRAAGTRDTVAGFGDLYLRVKTNFAGNSGGDFGFAVEPYLKLPTASDAIGNGALEGGMLVPLSYALSDTLSLGATPELDVLKNALDDGRHAAFQMPVSLTAALSATTTLSGELWMNVDGDPSATTRQYSADVAATWQPPGTKDLQLDCGVNFGLNKSTPDTQAYVGVSKRW